MSKLPSSFYDLPLDERLAFASSADITDAQATESLSLMATMRVIRQWPYDDLVAFAAALAGNPNLSLATLLETTDTTIAALNERNGDVELGRKIAPVVEALTLNPARDLELLAGSLSTDAVNKFFYGMRLPLHELLGGVDHIGRRHPKDVVEARREIQALLAAVPLSMAPTVMTSQIEELAVFLFERYLKLPESVRGFSEESTRTFLSLWEGHSQGQSSFDNLLLLDDDRIRALGKSPGATRWHLEYVLAQAFGTGIASYFPMPAFVAWAKAESAYEPSDAVRSWATG